MPIFVDSLANNDATTPTEQVQNAGMKVGLKNTVDLVRILEPWFDFAINESCYKYNECDVSLFTTSAVDVVVSLPGAVNLP